MWDIWDFKFENKGFLRLGDDVKFLRYDLY